MCVVYIPLLLPLLPSYPSRHLFVWLLCINIKLYKTDERRRRRPGPPSAAVPAISPRRQGNASAVLQAAREQEGSFSCVCGVEPFSRKRPLVRHQQHCSAAQEQRQDSDGDDYGVGGGRTTGARRGAEVTSMPPRRRRSNCNGEHGGDDRRRRHSSSDRALTTAGDGAIRRRGGGSSSPMTVGVCGAGH